MQRLRHISIKSALSLLLAGALLFSLSSCRGSDADTAGTSGITQSVTSAAADTARAAAAKEPSSPPDENSGGNSSNSAGQEGSSPSAAPAAGGETPGGVQNITANAEAESGDGIESVWTEVPIVDGRYVGTDPAGEFDPKKIVTEADYVFSGTVLSRHTYAVEWTDENGEPWGPFQKSVIEVKVDKEYFGTSPSGTDRVKIYYPFSLSMTADNFFRIQDGGEYVFITKALDEEFVRYRNTHSPHDRHGQENHADVYISDACFEVMPIEAGSVILYHEYFSWDADVAGQVQSGNLPETDKIVSDALARQGYFAAMDAEIFDAVFPGLFLNPDAVPDADALSAVVRPPAPTASGENTASEDGPRGDTVNPLEDFALTIAVEDTTVRQGENFAVHVEMKNNSGEDCEIACSYLFWPQISGWRWRPFGDVEALELPYPQTRRFAAGGLLRNIGLSGEEGGPFRFGEDLAPGTYELKFSASFWLNWQQDNQQEFRILSNPVMITVQ